MPAHSRARRVRWWLLGAMITVAMAWFAAPSGIGASGAASAAGKPTIVLEHGAWADATSWRNVIERLQRRGFTVLAPPNPLRGWVTDSAYLRSFLRTISGPVVLVGHSYGGFVITNAARGNPAGTALVHVDGFTPAAPRKPPPRTTGSC